MSAPSAIDRSELAALLQRVAARDRAAFTALYARTSAKLFGATLRILRRRDLAEEILQEVYVRVWERAGDYDPALGSALGWLSTIARNRALDATRRRVELPLEDLPQAWEIADPADDPAREAERSGELRRLSACLETLADDRRSMVVLAYRDGLTRDELATRFGVPVGTVKTWLHRSLARLKECLGA